jgi:hypothetical protein
VTTSDKYSLQTTPDNKNYSDLPYRATTYSDDIDLPYRATTYSHSRETDDNQYSTGGTGKSTSTSRLLKTSPTSVADISNHTNVRWSDNLNQRPSAPRRTAERPTSILRKKRSDHFDDCPSDESTLRPEKAVRISDEPDDCGSFFSDAPSAMGFVDSTGRILSPIPSRSLDGSGSQDDDDEEGPSDENNELPNWMMASRSSTSFEKNIPEEFQRAFLTENAVRILFCRDLDAFFVS